MTSAVAGWYEDEAGAQRWWDGSSWTGQARWAEHNGWDASGAVEPVAQPKAAAEVVRIRERERVRTAERPSVAEVFAAKLRASDERGAAAGASLNAELTRLAAFRADGVLDDEEFRAAKRHLLGL